MLKGSKAFAYNDFLFGAHRGAGRDAPPSIVRGNHLDRSIPLRHDPDWPNLLINSLDRGFLYRFMTNCRKIHASELRDISFLT